MEMSSIYEYYFFKRVQERGEGKKGNIAIVDFFTNSLMALLIWNMMAFRHDSVESWSLRPVGLVSNLVFYFLDDPNYFLFVFISKWTIFRR